MHWRHLLAAHSRDRKANGEISKGALTAEPPVPTRLKTPTRPPRSVLVHVRERAQSGHYYAFKKEKYAWLKCDDESIPQVTKAEVLKAHVYMLFY